MDNKPKLSISLWFDNQAEEAARFYTSVFKNSKLGRITYYGKDGHEMHRAREGTVLTVEFEINGQEFVALNGGPEFKFTEAVSLVVNCESQAEVDYYWEKLSEGGDPAAQQCGWLKDKYGLSWQVVPTALTKLMHAPDSVKVQRMLNAMYPMKKLEIEALTKAFEG